MRIFLIGASGVIGRALVPLLRDAGHCVTGTSRTAQGVAELEGLGICAMAVDVYASKALEQALAADAPDVVISQLTDLSGGIDPASPAEALRRNARLRREGTANVVRAVRRAGVKRLIVQSIAWAYAPETPPYHEGDPLDLYAAGLRAVSVGQGVAPLENAVLHQDDFEGIVLRYGQLYGPGTWSNEPSGTSPLHVHAAAYAALLAVDRGRPGVYNIADPGGEAAIDLAISELGWNPDFRVDA